MKKSKKRVSFLVYFTGTKLVIYALNLSTNETAILFMQRGIVLIYGVYLIKSFPQALRKKGEDFEIWCVECGTLMLFVGVQQCWDFVFTFVITYVPFWTLFNVAACFLIVILGYFFVVCCVESFGRRHYSKSVWVYVWTSTFFIILKPLGFVKRFLAFMYSIFNAHKLGDEDKQIFVSKFDEKTYELSKGGYLNGIRSFVRKFYPRVYRLRHEHSCRVLQIWTHTPDPILNHENLKGVFYEHSVENPEKKSRFHGLNKAFHWCKKSFLQAGEMQFYHMLNDF